MSIFIDSELGQAVLLSVVMTMTGFSVNPQDSVELSDIHKKQNTHQQQVERVNSDINMPLDYARAIARITNTGVTR